jgi:hypothetical protein
MPGAGIIVFTNPAYLISFLAIYWLTDPGH